MRETLSVRLGALLVLFFSMPGLSVAPASGKHRSLLQRGSHRGGGAAGRASSSVNASRGARAEKAAELSSWGQPQLKGHFLNSLELRSTNSIACLQAKQANPNVNCEPWLKTVPRAPPPINITLNAGNFPSWQDAVCQSNGAYLCDPYDVLDNETRLVVATELASLRQTAPISCGKSLDSEVDRDHYQAFYVGVVILKDWPISQSAPDYLQQLGQLVAANWSMDELYTGSGMPYSRCPNTGILFIIPENDQVYLSTDSCRFLCQAKGGPEVTTAALAALRGPGGAYGAVVTGIRTLYAFLQKSQSPPIDSSGQIIISGSGYLGQVGSATMAAAENEQDNWWNTVLRVLFVMSLILLCFSLAVAALMFLFTPELYKKSRKR